MFSRRTLRPQMIRTPSPLGEVLVDSSSESSSPEDTQCAADSLGSPSAEEVAASLLGKWIEQADVLKLFDCLPRSTPPRGGGGGTSFATGAFAKVKVGLRSNVAVFPGATEALAAFVRQSAPAHKFTTIVVFDSVLTTQHRDQPNSFLPNLVVPVSSFTQGSIWVQSCNGPSTRVIDGTKLRGVSLPVCDGPVLFDARRSVHLTDAWTGRRVVLVAFSMSAIDKLSSEAAARLTSLRFALPSRDDVEHFRKFPQLPAHLPWPPRFPLQVQSSAEVPVQEPAACSAVAPPPVEPLFLELCAGTAMLSRCFREAGVPVMPIDHQHNRHHLLAKVCSLSLTKDSTWSFLSDRTTPSCLCMLLHLVARALDQAQGCQRGSPAVAAVSHGASFASGLES